MAMSCLSQYICRVLLEAVLGSQSQEPSKPSVHPGTQGESELVSNRHRVKQKKQSAKSQPKRH